MTAIRAGDNPPAFELPNVGAGPDPLSLEDLTTDPDTDYVVLLFQRDYHCRNCRKQVTDIADHYDAFRDRHTTVVSLLPEPVDRAADWQAAYDLPFPLLADPEASVGTDYDQPVRFGVLGRVSDFFGRMPEAVVVDAVEEPTIATVRRGRSTWDRPDAGELLQMLPDEGSEDLTP